MEVELFASFLAYEKCPEGALADAGTLIISSTFTRLETVQKLPA